MKVPHIRIVHPGERGELNGSLLRGARVYVTLPDHEEIELRALTGYSTDAHIDAPTAVTLEMYATVEEEFA